MKALTLVALGIALAACDSSSSGSGVAGGGGGLAGSSAAGAGATASAGTNAASGAGGTVGAAGVGGNVQGSAGSAGAPGCPAKNDPPAAQDACAKDADCVLVDPLKHCCGSDVYAVPIQEASAWNAAAAKFNACSCPEQAPCFQDASRAEDSTVPNGMPAVARCLQGRCVASYVSSCAAPPVPDSRACEKQADCATAILDTTCCKRTAFGLSAVALNAFQDAWTQYTAACRGECLTGCFPPPPSADDGSVAASDEQPASVFCVDKVCVSSFGK